ncbi:MAG: hypothetical protein SNJ71_00120 [Bacteroidales bacterium]
MIQRIMSISGGTVGGIIACLVELLQNISWVTQIVVGAVIGTIVSWLIVKILNGIEKICKLKKYQ